MRLEAAAKTAPYVHPRLASLAVAAERVIRSEELTPAERRERALKHLASVFEVAAHKPDGVGHADR
jgi:hypothetical protein